MKAIFFFVSALLTTTYFYFIYRYSVNIPSLKDFDQLLAFALDWQEVSNFAQYPKILTSSFADNLSLTPQLAALISVQMFGGLDFTALVWLGNIALLFSYIVFCKGVIGQEGRFKPALLLIPFLVFNPQYSKIAISPSAATGNMLFIFFSLLAFLLASHKKNLYYYFCLGSSLLAVLSHSTGVLVLPCLSLVFFLKEEGRRSVLFIILFLLFFSLQLMSFDLAGLGLSFTKILSHLSTDLGSLVTSSRELAHLYGGALILVFCLLVVPLFKKNLFVGASLVFFLLSSLAYAFNASLQVTEPPFSNRLVASFFIASIWVAVFEIIETDYLARKMSLLGFFMGPLFLLVSHLRYSADLPLQRLERNDSALRFQATSQGLLHHDQEQATSLIYQAERLEVYSLPVQDLSSALHKPIAEGLIVRNAKIHWNLEHIIIGSQHILIDGYAFFKGMSQFGISNTQLRLKGAGGKTWTLNSNSRQRPDISKHLRRPDVINSGFLTIFRRDSIPPGAYQIFLMISNQGINFYEDTGQVIVIEEQRSV